MTPPGSPLGDRIGKLHLPRRLMAVGWTDNQFGVGDQETQRSASLDQFRIGEGSEMIAVTLAIEGDEIDAHAGMSLTASKPALRHLDCTRGR